MTKKYLALVVLMAGVFSCKQLACAADPAHAEQPIVPPAEAISRLKDGNGRYTSGNQQHPHESSEERTYMATASYENLGMTAAEAATRRAELKTSQHPFAIVLSCSDSRVPPEIVFDQGLGDLFVIRVAGNVIDDHSLGSIEYAADHLAVRLIVVLGHQRCGAVKAAKETIAAKTEAPAHIQSLVTVSSRRLKRRLKAT
jgi:carbonic anhydrase